MVPQKKKPLAAEVREGARVREDQLEHPPRRALRARAGKGADVRVV